MPLFRRHFIAAAGASLYANSWARKKSFNAVYFQDFEPFSIGQDQQVSGLYIDILNEVLGNQMGIDVVHRGMPWTRALSMVRDGDADAFVTLVTPERQAYAIAGTSSVYDSPIYLYASPNHPQIALFRAASQVADLQPYLLGTYVGNSLIKAVPANMKIVTTSTQAQAALMAVEQRVDLTIGNDLQTISILKSINRPKGLVRLMRVTDKPLPNFLQIGTSSPWVSILPRVDKILAEMKKDGRMENIIDRYR